MSTITQKVLTVTIILGMMVTSLVAQTVPEGLLFKQFSTAQGLPTSKVHRLLQDSDGYIWIATYYGLFRYDGYSVREFKVNTKNPSRLVHNNVLSLCEDHQHRLWIGTQEGLNRLDLNTGKMRTYLLKNVPRQRIQSILESRDGDIYIGYLRGLYRYDELADTIVMMAGPLYSGQIPEKANCQSIIEDADGDLIISTWAQGLYRYIPSQKRFIHYDMASTPNSTPLHHQRLLRDTYGNIWLGTYGHGLMRLTFSTDKQELHTESYVHCEEDESSLLSDYVLSFVEHPQDHLIWVGTRQGVSVMKVDALGKPHFINYSDLSAQHYFPEKEVNEIICDAEGMVWMGTENGGVYHTNLNSSLFNTLNTRDLSPFSSNSIEGLYVAQDGAIWAGLGYNLAYIHDKEIRSVYNEPVIVQGISYSRHQGKVLVALRDVGLSLCADGRQIELYKNPDALCIPSNNIHHVAEDSLGNWWIATYRGLGVKYADGREVAFDKEKGEELLTCDMSHVAFGQGSVWLSTSTQGIIRISGNLQNPEEWEYRQYTQDKGNLPGNSASLIYTDREGRIWTGLETCGLCLYHPDQDQFESVHEKFNIPGDIINSIEQDSLGNFWMGTNQALVCFSLTGQNLNSMHIFSNSDGLPGNFFNPGSSCQHNGTLYFGCNQGLVYFRPTITHFPQRKVVCSITDMMVNGTSISRLSWEEQSAIANCEVTHAEEINLSHQYDNFEIHFASLSYNTPERNRYAYRLLGFDSNWRHVDAGSRIAYYDHLPAGNYTFEVKGTNEHGDWSQVRRLRITITPPWWLSWWAYIIYFCILLAIIWYIGQMLKNKVMLRNALKVKEMEAEKVEELNHVKLQFFANITHELVTPLTIISASLDELKSQVTGEQELLDTMEVNVRRLIRLLQQILEFRKAETGNLKLRVANGNLALFLQHEVESFIPLIRKRHLQVSIHCQQEVMMGFFDPDKVDKMVYNLLSNAAKYTPAGGSIQLNATYTDGHRNILISVRDTGRGMSDQQKAGLFRRFYEGDYRQSHTIGTGIGLALVRDLVNLHRGTIQVESAVDKGTTFFIELPIEAEAYDKEQIIQIEEEMETNKVIHTDEELSTANTQQVEPEAESDEPKILLVEDNDELRTVMSRLLKREYQVLLAANGAEALHIMHTEDIRLVVSDVIMPEMDGIEMTRRAKNDVEVCHIPIILLTAKRTEEDRDAGYLAGADAYLTKPFSLSVLQARIHNLLHSRERDADNFKNEVVIDIKNLNYTDIDQDFLSRAIACVNNHLGDASFEIVQFADEMASSRSTLYKKLRALTNLNPSGFMRNIRLKAACKVIEENPNVRVNELAYSVGFNDPKYFSICFRKEFGMLPTEYSRCFKPETGDEEDEGGGIMDKNGVKTT